MVNSRTPATFAPARRGSGARLACLLVLALTLLPATAGTAPDLNYERLGPLVAEGDIAATCEAVGAAWIPAPDANVRIQITTGTWSRTTITLRTIHADDGGSQPEEIPTFVADETRWAISEAQAGTYALKSTGPEAMLLVLPAFTLSDETLGSPSYEDTTFRAAWADATVVVPAPLAAGPSVKTVIPSEAASEGHERGPQARPYTVGPPMPARWTSPTADGPEPDSPGTDTSGSAPPAQHDVAIYVRDIAIIDDSNEPLPGSDAAYRTVERVAGSGAAMDVTETHLRDGWLRARMSWPDGWPTGTSFGCRDLDMTIDGLATAYGVPAVMANAGPTTLTMAGRFEIHEVVHDDEAETQGTAPAHGVLRGDYAVVAADFQATDAGIARYAAPLSAAAAMLALAALWGGRSPWGALLVAYSRLTRSELLDHDTRAMVYDAIEAHSAASISEIVRATGLARGVVRHHIQHLAQATLIRVVEAAGERILVPAHVTTHGAIRMRAAQKPPLAFIMAQIEDRAMTKVDLITAIEERFGFSRSAARRWVSKAGELGLAEIPQGNRGVKIHAVAAN